MNIGIIYCGYNNIQYTQESIKVFIEARKNNLIKQICAVSLPFLEYHDINTEEDQTPNFLSNLYKLNQIDNIFTNPRFIKEHLARDLCLQYLKIMDVDLIWLVDADEFYKYEDIINIINYINKNEAIWYKLNFKNYIFDGKQWIDGFCPPRIFRAKQQGYTIKEFYWDNDIAYEDQNQKQISHNHLFNLEIPKNIAHIKHLTWLHENGKNKYEYQMKHFGHCGYKWNYQLNELEFNQEYYLKNNEKTPIINYE
jgi:hypothetical protein